MSHRATIACLTGAGTAPELMAEAVLALDAVARLHGLSIDETHVPFGGVAVARGGQAFPASTRSAILAADAVLVAGAEEPALAEVMSELDLRAQRHAGALRPARRRRVRLAARRRRERVGDRGGIPDRRVAHACASPSSATLPGTTSSDAVAAHTSTCRSSISRRRSRSRSQRSTRAGSTSSRSRPPGPSRWSRSPRRRHVRALRRTACSPSTGRASSCPSPDGGFAIAGGGVVNPSSMLLAAAMMLEHGLGSPGRGGDARRRRLGGARRRAADAGPAAPRRRRDDARVHLPRGRRLPALEPERRVLGGPDADGGGAAMNGADADPPLARGRGCRRDVRAAGRRDPAALRRDGARHDRASRPRASRAGRRAHGRGLRTRVGQASASPSRRRARARRTSSRRSPTRGWTRRRSSASPARCSSFLIGTDAFQECDITGITIPIVKHSWLVQDVSEMPHVMKAAFHVASTGRCGPVLVDIPRDVQEAEIDFVLPRRGHPPGLEAAAPWPPAADQGRRSGDRRGGAAHPLRRRRRAERARDRRAARARRGRHACRS